MKKAALLLTICIMFMILIPPAFAGVRRVDVPRVAYLAPGNDIVIDLTGKDSLTFQWKSGPTPGGGRESYRFKLFKGFSYDSIVSETLGQNVFSIEVPQDKFKDGQTYSWCVEQRDASNMIWSLHDTWSFKVIKKR